MADAAALTTVQLAAQQAPSALPHATVQTPAQPASAQPPTALSAQPPTTAAPLVLLPAEDRRALRSKRLLRRAFTELAQERGLDGFSVSDLTEKADINRGTFYAHYKDMAELLGSYEDEIITSLSSLKPKIKSVSLKELLAFSRKGTPPQVTIELFDLLREHGDLLRTLLSPSGDALFQARLRDRLCADIVRSILHRKYTENPTALTEYYIAYYASATLGLIQRWLERGMAESSDEMARILLSVMILKPGEHIQIKGGKR